MKVFVSWSGERGRRFAEAVFHLLRAAGNGKVEPWMSTQISHGRPWASELLAQLDECRACIVCVTSDTVGSRWLGFEAGAVLGAGADPNKVVCLGLDLEPAVIEGHLLARFPLFDASADGMRGLWEMLFRETEPAWPDASWQLFQRECVAVPDAAPREFTVYLDFPGGLTAHSIQLDHDVAFDKVLSALLESRGVQFDVAQRNELRCLDFDAERWMSMPRRVSSVGISRVAILHSSAMERYRGSEKLASIQLREGIDVIPKVNAAIACLRRDLRDLMAMQAAFHAKNGNYADSLATLDFLPAAGNMIELVVDDKGFAARGRCETAPRAFGVRLGDGAGSFEGQPNGEVFLA